jgi:hypothetical protein
MAEKLEGAAAQTGHFQPIDEHEIAIQLQQRIEIHEGGEVGEKGHLVNKTGPECGCVGGIGVGDGREYSAQHRPNDQPGVGSGPGDSDTILAARQPAVAGVNEKGRHPPIEQKAAPVEFTADMFGHQPVRHLVEADDDQVGGNEGEETETAAGAEGELLPAVQIEKENGAGEDEEEGEQAKNGGVEPAQPTVERGEKIVEAGEGEFGVEEAIDEAAPAAGRVAGGERGGEMRIDVDRFFLQKAALFQFPDEVSEVIDGKSAVPFEVVERRSLKV